MSGTSGAANREVSGASTRNISSLQTTFAGGIVKIAPQIDLGRSLNQVFGTITTTTGQQIEEARDRQTATARTILKRFFHKQDSKRRELVILADEVGLGKTYVALAVAVSILDAIRRGESPEGLPANRPAVLVLTPNNDALFNKWKREAESFRQDCANPEGSLAWLQIRSPVEDSTKSGNIIDLALVMREATRHKPMLMIAKQSVFGAALNDRDSWRRRA